MISRTCFASCQAFAIRSRRLGPLPSTDSSSAARFSITARTSAPNRPTSFFARIGPIPFTKPLPRYRSIPSAVVGGTVFMVVALNCSPCSFSLLPAYFHPKDAEAAFVVVEGDPLDDTGNFLGRGSAVRDCCIHVRGFI